MLITRYYYIIQLLEIVKYLNYRKYYNLWIDTVYLTGGYHMVLLKQRISINSKLIKLSSSTVFNNVRSEHKNKGRVLSKRTSKNRLTFSWLSSRLTSVSIMFSLICTNGGARLSAVRSINPVRMCPVLYRSVLPFLGCLTLCVAVSKWIHA